MSLRLRTTRPCVDASTHLPGFACRAMAGLMRSATLIGALAGAVLTASIADAREKIDTITMENGDRVTGEIKNLDAGILTVSCDHLGTVSVEWVGVASVESTQLFEIIDAEGTQFVGTFEPGNSDGELAITGPDGRSAILQRDRVVRIAQIGRTRWQRWRGDISLGASFTSANNQRDLTLDAEATYQNERFRVRNTLSGSISDREDASKTSWGTLIANYQWYLSNRWFWYSQLQFDRNEELDLKLRSTVSGGGGRYLVSTSRSQLYASLGVSALQEIYAPDEEGDWSTEIALAADYEFFLFQGRDTSFSSSLSVLPSLSVSGRYRVDYAVSFNRKLVHDFTFSLNLSGSYDSMPPEDSKASDNSFRVNLGWSF